MVICVDFDGKRIFYKNDDIYNKISLWKQNQGSIV